MSTQALIFLMAMAGWMNRKQQFVIEYLLEENRVLKGQLDASGKKLRFTNAQRRNLAKKGRKLGWQGLQQYVSLVRPETILAWHRKFVALKYTAQRRNPFRRKRMKEIKELCIKFASENPEWGYGRIQGALFNIGFEVSTTTVGNILRAAGIVPAPERQSPSNWQRFIRSHMDVTAVADFLSVEVWTFRGLVRYQVFFVMKLAQRQVQIVHIGCQINGQVMEQLARNLTDPFDGFLTGIEYFVCDHDSLFTRAFKQTLNDCGVEVIQTRVGCPQQNGYAESFVAAIKRECLNHLIFFGEKSLRRAISEYLEHFHHERNHQGIENRIPFPTLPKNGSESGLIQKSERLGGLLNYSNRDERKEEEKAA